MGVPVRYEEKETITGFGLWLSFWEKASKKAGVCPRLGAVREQQQFYGWVSH